VRPAERAGTPARASLPSWVSAPLAVLFVTAVPLCLVANNVRWVTLSPDTYRQGFEKYRAAQRTGLSREQLEQVARAFIDYFLGPPGRLEPQVNLGGTVRPLFNEREVAHMEDVQQLMQLVFRLGVGAGLALLALAAGLLVWRRRAALPLLGRLLAWGSGLSIGLLLLVAGLSLLDFGELFLRFHELSFSNDLWMLDPRRDYLIMLFPQGFWLDVTLRIAALTAFEAVALGALGFWLARRSSPG
jgi:integral membrane protein (TIGR01906 family)